ncbi:MAG: phosphosulfolactate synthase [Desulfobacterota bacterium]|nr:phosphosulfolactate synthase [Thermodesulfobacteriota bacterium]
MAKKPEQMAFDFIDIPSRSEKPRSKGLVMVLDKGMGIEQGLSLMPAAAYIDIIKLGWGTARLFSEAFIREKITLFKRHGIIVSNGGTFLEIAYQQNKIDLFFEYCHHIGIEAVEVSNGIIDISRQIKAAIIRRAASQGFFVMSEVGKKDPARDHQLSLQERVTEAKSDLDAGAQFIIIEAREGGRSLGVYDDTGALKQEMARFLAEKIGIDKIMFEAPDKSQQTQLMMLFGRDVNLGNIRPDDVIPLETLRRGIRGDTFGKLQDRHR